MWGYYSYEQTTSTNDFDFNGHLRIEIDTPKKEAHQEIVLFDPKNLVLEN